MTARNHQSAGPVGSAAQTALTALRGKTLPMLLARVGELDQAVRLLLAGHHDTNVLRQAERAAHQIVGAAGTFGYHRATEIARELENTFGTTFTSSARSELLEAGSHTADRVQALRRALQHTTTRVTDEPPVTEQDVADTAIAEQPVSVPDRRRLLIASRDVRRGGRLAEAAKAHGFHALLAADLSTARSALTSGMVAAALVDSDIGGAETVELVTELTGACPNAPILVLSGDDLIVDRVVTFRAGARGFLPASWSADDLIGAVRDALSRGATGAGRLLAVDDDPVILNHLQTLFATAGMQLTTENDPRRFWQTLNDTAPDLLLLDLDMPQVTGLELCRLLRADPRWATLPVLVLTGRAGSEAVTEVFTAGADDYVSKPVVPAELLARVTNRLERVRLYRQLAETDPLTGLANRRRFTADFDYLQLLSIRHQQPLSFALLDLDTFKNVNDTYGHAVGDTVLQRLADLLRRHFRGEDIIARWGGEELALGLYGMTRDDGVTRVTSALETMREETFDTPGHPPLHITFSAGVAEYGPDGSNLHTLYRAADQVLYRAKALGRNRVLPVDAPERPDLARPASHDTSH